MKWRFAADRGGTFTDVVAVDPRGRWHGCKVLSRSPRYEDPTVEGIRQLLGHPAGEPLPAAQVAWIRLGTTVATNALLERKGAATGLVITRGFRDLVAIGDQRRPDLFALTVTKPAPLYQAVVEVAERMDSQGRVLVPLDLAELRAGLTALRQQGCESIAIVFLHAWRNPQHEQWACQVADTFGFRQVIPSHRSLPLLHMTRRGQTTVVDAYLTPVLQDYLARLQPWVPGIPVWFMSSAGSLLQPGDLLGKDAVLSGPAGGVLGVAHLHQACGAPAVIGFDMGGTSTDVCRFDGQLERHLESHTAGIAFESPRLRVETVAAGGGSMLRYDQGRLTVGPDSAGADPGPACYGLGGPATLTDANLVLGRLVVDHFPRLFGPGRDQPLDEAAARQALTSLADQMAAAGEAVPSVEALALGFVAIADETMAGPIHALSVARGFDPRQHGLVCFGGAGGQHAGGVARHLGMPRVYIHPLAGLLSAMGMALAPMRRHGMRTLLRPLDRPGLAAARRTGLAMVQAWGVAGGRMVLTVEVRVSGTDATLTLDWQADPAPLVRQFRHLHGQTHGFDAGDHPLELVHVQVDWVDAADSLVPWAMDELPVAMPQPLGVRNSWFCQEDGTLAARATPVWSWPALPADWQTVGPALVVGPWCTVVVEPGWHLAVGSQGLLTLTCPAPWQETLAGEQRDPVLLALFHHRFMAVAIQMGELLARTAHSVNIKERLDFSCAVFDRQGRLIANAPHIPVHLGAMGACVVHLLREREEELQAGDVYLTNAPHAGGSHLPDVTAITPVFRGNRLAFFVANRGHHADIGGLAPGSMSPFARSLTEEGVVLSNLLVVRQGRLLEEEVSRVLTAGPYPVRQVTERLADLRAQAAANHRGAAALTSLCDRYGDRVVTAYMTHMREHAALAMEEALASLLGDQSVWQGSFADTLDQGATLAVTITLFRNGEGRPRARVSFDGTSPCLDSNLNAPPAVVRSAVLYAFRLLMARPVPLNDGCLLPITLIIPAGSLLSPGPAAAVAGGNVETSQRVVDVLLAALGQAAASQGTMNNFLFGREGQESRPYYETIAGGAGATAAGRGADGVQVHMTNTRITDPEVLESRYPEVRVETFTLRPGSGGAGHHRGGDGVVRGFRFMTEVIVTLLGERRQTAPFGLAGGQAGLSAVNLWIHAQGQEEILPGQCQIRVQPGDRIILYTPGGGGFGTPS